MVDLRKLCVIAAGAVVLWGGCKSDEETEQPSGPHGSAHADAGEHDSGPQDEDKEVDEGGETLGPLSGGTCPTDHAELTYEKFGQAFMTTYCTRCHSSKLKTLTARMNATLEHDFDVYDLIKGVHSHIDRKAAAGPEATNTSMPPSDPKPTLAERQKLGQWLACEFGPATE